MNSYNVWLVRSDKYIWWPCSSSYRVALNVSIHSGIVSVNVFDISLMMLLCLYLSCSRNFGQEDRTWFSICMRPHKVHLSLLDLPQSLRLAFVVRVLMDEFRMNFMVFLGRACKYDCHVASIFISSRRVRR